MIKNFLKTGRIVAVEALVRQEQEGYSNLVLDSLLKKANLPLREIAFASALFYGVLERMFTLDYLLQQCLKQPLQKLDSPVRNILRIGLYQVQYMDNVPISAAVNESVQLTRTFRKASASKLVNAVLRKACKIELSFDEFDKVEDRLHVQYSVSYPIAKHFLLHYNKEAEKILQGFAEKPVLALRVNTLKITVSALIEQLQQEGWNCRQGEVPFSVIAEGKGSIVKTKAFEKGLFHVQGLASQLACAYLNPSPNSKTIDLCAAPGGKSATLAQYMENKGVLWSNDLHLSRVSLIEKNFQTLGIEIGKTTANDASILHESYQEADFVLCDVPCSGLGILAKKPDIRCKQLETIEQLYPIQQKILKNGASYLKQGGRLVYSTCTLNPLENEYQIEQFLQEHKEFRLVEPPMLPKQARVEKKMLTLFPTDGLYDGFFIAILEKI